MVVLFCAWWFNILANESGVVITSVFILMLGIIGGVITTLIKRNQYPENSVIFWWVNIIGSIITTAGVFIVFVPVMSLLLHIGVTASIFMLGFLAPIYMPYLINRLRNTKNA